VIEIGNDKAPILEKKISEVEGGGRKKIKKIKIKKPHRPIAKNWLKGFLYFFRVNCIFVVCLVIH
jgi:hypothetical protein